MADASYIPKVYTKQGGDECGRKWTNATNNSNTLLLNIHFTKTL